MNPLIRGQNRVGSNNPHKGGHESEISAPCADKVTVTRGSPRASRSAPSYSNRVSSTPTFARGPAAVDCARVFVTRTGSTYSRRSL